MPMPRDLGGKTCTLYAYAPIILGVKLARCMDVPVYDFENKNKTNYSQEHSGSQISSRTRGKESIYTVDESSLSFYWQLRDIRNEDKMFTLFNSFYLTLTIMRFRLDAQTRGILGCDAGFGVN